MSTKIPRQNFDVGQIISDCASNYRDNNLKTRFGNSSNYITKHTKLYAFKAIRVKLDEFLVHDTVDEVTKSEMVNLYTNKFSKEEFLKSKYYDVLRSSSPDGLCPYCNHIPVDTLDHYLPKAKYPTFSVTPNNLVPSCMRCNKQKDRIKHDTIHIHPCFDDFDSIFWLKAQIVDHADLIIKYHVDVSTVPVGKDKHKLLNHFKVFSLNDLFSIQARVELNYMKMSLQETFKLEGSDGLKRTLERNYNTYSEINRNCWQSALYYCLSTDLKFITGTVMNI